VTFAVIIEARMTAGTASGQLPGRLLQFLGREMALVRCLDRCAEIPGVDEVVCAVPADVVDDPVADVAKRAGYRVIRGVERDALSDYAAAAQDVGADLVMRVRSDCPFIDPKLCGRVRDLYLVSHRSHGAEYACNDMPQQFPQGLECEVFSAERLLDAAWLARSYHERQHVTAWLRSRGEILRACLAGPGAGLEELRWTVHDAADLAFARAVYDELGERAAIAPWVELAALCLRRPDLPAINAGRGRNRRRAAPRADLQTTPMRFSLAA
jgi:spore coat polysaccharide biosynthesis protein SpsF (cytidylyltransferase family)